MRRRRALLAAGAVTAFAGCGFQLRGSAALPYKTLYVGFAEGSSFGAEFKRSIRVAADTRVVDRPEQAEARLEPLAEVREKEIVGFSTTGRPREYQVRLRFRFRVIESAGREAIPATELILRRDITISDTQLIAKEQEEAMLYREMQTDMVQQLLRRMAAIRR